MHVLIVEDDPLLSDGMTRLLRASAYQVSCVGSAEAAAALLAKEPVDLMLLDIGLPGMDGIAFLQKLRAAHDNVLILILTARDALNEKVRGLTLGADDYLSKPFASEELLARVLALVRRAAKPVSQRRVHGPLVLDPDSHRASAGGVALDMPLREWSVLNLLVDNAGKIVSKERIVRRLCDWDQELSSNTVEIYVSRLRAKLSAYGIHIKTVRGMGYLLEAWRGT